MQQLNSHAETVEEQFEGIGTGVEVELDADDNIRRPWDPELIRVATKNFSIRNVLDMIDAEDIELAPDFQRNKVWKPRQKSRLIESLLLQIPLPAFYLAEDGDGLLRVVDGLQRLSTIHDFSKGVFPLADLEYLSSSEGSRFGDLPAPMRRRLLNTQLVAHVIDPSTPPAVKYDIFKRINTGGDPLNSMEIRHCMSQARSRSFLKRLAQSPEFDLATGGGLMNHVRMNDREAVLRFTAFDLLGDLADYDIYGSLEDLLNWANGCLDDPRQVTDVELDRIESRFLVAMRNAYNLFGEHAFRKWPVGEDRLMPINRALFESWGVALADLTPDQVVDLKDEIVSKARNAMASDGLYIASISSSTSDPRRVETRFKVASEIVKA